MYKKKAVKSKCKKVKKVRRCGPGRTSDKKTAKKKSKKKAKKVGRSELPAFANSFAKGNGRIHVRTDHRKAAETPVPASKIREGLRRARGDLDGIFEELDDLTERYRITGIELEVSFSAEGKLLGIGVGGATSIKVAFSPPGDD